MDSRREFLKKAAMLSGAAGISSVLPPSIQRALAINPELGSTYLDAEHVVILMQENRSFDHCYGTLQGVRGFNDPRAIDLPNKNRVWLQTNAAGETYAPFRLNIKDTKSTWMGSLPHSWTNQVDARNEGKYDRWLEAKKSGHKDYKKMPLTLGYYNREDIPFYYSLADAFTVCDQNFCSSLTGTTPNRLYLWTGTVREEQHAESYANVRNENLDYDALAHWTTFPERLEALGISWKIYQNELSVGVGFEGEEDGWLSNFTDNPIEWFEQYHVKFLPAYIRYIPKLIEQLEEAIRNQKKTLLQASGDEKEKRRLQQLEEALTIAKADQQQYTAANYEKLSPREKAIHEKAFVTNLNDPHYHELATLRYNDDGTEREVKIPKGDTLFQFREDVKKGSLPTVSWLVAPENFSDHPGAPWYGAWYVSEVMDILTQNPEVWKKTIFVLAYDENDGYFDHVPPFTPPHPSQPHSGKVSAGIDAAVEYVTLQQDMKKKAAPEARESSIGLGYRVPLVIASPWSRGGAVCSQVFDHTSVLQLLEKVLTHKTGKKVEETNISAWRRTVCGDLTSVFKPYQGEKIALPSFVKKDTFIEGVHKAQFKKDPSGYKALSKEEVEAINRNPLSSTLMVKQEKGIRTACALPYELYAEGQLSADKKSFQLSLQASNKIFGAKAAGSPFNVYAPGKYKAVNQSSFEAVRTWSYAVAPGDTLTDNWPLNDFENNLYHLRTYGPNGFYREYKGNANDPALTCACVYAGSDKKSLSGHAEITLKNLSRESYTIEVVDNAYKTAAQQKTVKAGSTATVTLNLDKTFGWYDVTVRVKGATAFERRYAGKAETGKAGFTDPAMGQTI